MLVHVTCAVTLWDFFFFFFKNKKRKQDHVVFFLCCHYTIADTEVRYQDSNLGL